MSKRSGVRKRRNENKNFSSNYFEKILRFAIFGFKDFSQSTENGNLEQIEFGVRRMDLCRRFDEKAEEKYPLHFLLFFFCKLLLIVYFTRNIDCQKRRILKCR